MNIVVLVGLLFSASSFATTVQFETNMGNFEVELFDEATPKSVANFLAYVNSKAYDNSIIHRSIKDFIIQGGGFRSTGGENLLDIPANDPVVNEFDKSNLRGTIAYAKLGGKPNSATNGWFINLADNSGNLDTQNEGFTVFGKVIGEGMIVVDKIAALKVFKFDGAFANTPLQNFTDVNKPNDTNFVIITSVRVIDSDTIEDTVEVETKKSSGGGSMGLLFILLLFSAFILRRSMTASFIKVQTSRIRRK